VLFIRTECGWHWERNEEGGGSVSVWGKRECFSISAMTPTMDWEMCSLCFVEVKWKEMAVVISPVHAATRSQVGVVSLEMNGYAVCCMLLL